MNKKYGHDIDKEALQEVITEIQRGNIDRRQAYSLMDAFQHMNR